MNKQLKPGEWIGVDLDRTLATYNSGDYLDNPAAIGEPIQPMVDRVNKWLDAGMEVRVLTARVASRTPRYERDAFRELWPAWSRANFKGRLLPLTAEKDYEMVELWDDRAVRLIPNTGLTAEESIVEILNSTGDKALEQIAQTGTIDREVVKQMLNAIMGTLVVLDKSTKGTLLFQ